MFSAATFVSLALAAAPVFADLGKDTLFPDGLHDPLIKFDTIGTSAIRETRGSSVPQVCKDYGSGKAWGMDGDIQCDVANMEAREVFYEDCEQSWTLCRCPDANMSLDQMQERFGQVPVGIRSYVGAALATKADGCNAVCFNGNFIRFHGDCPMTVFLHEAGHAFDQGFSGSDTFKNAIAADSCVPDGYANSNEAEDWTQVNVLLTYTKQFEPLPKDPGCLQNQFNALANDDRIKQGQETKQCLPDKRPFLTPNENTPPAEPETPPAEPETPTAEPEAPPAETTTPAEPPVISPPGPVDPVPEEPPKGCKSAKFRFRNKAKRAFRVVRRYVANKLAGTVTIPYGTN